MNEDQFLEARKIQARLKVLNECLNSLDSDLEMDLIIQNLWKLQYDDEIFNLRDRILDKIKTEIAGLKYKFETL